MLMLPSDDRDACCTDIIDPLDCLEVHSPPERKMALLPSPILSFWAERLQGLLAALQSHPAGLAVNAVALILLAALAMRWVIGVLKFLWAYFLRPCRNLRAYGEWAVSSRKWRLIWRLLPPPAAASRTADSFARAW